MVFTDTEIINAIRQGKENPDPYLVHLYTQLRGPVQNYILSNNGTQEEATEILHESIITFFEKTQEGQLKIMKSISGYLVTSCKNIFINRKKKAQKMTSMNAPDGNFEEPVEFSSPSDFLQKEDHRRLTQDMLRNVGKNCHQLLIWSDGEGRPMKWIAKELGYSSDQAAMNAKSTCKKKLVNMVRENENYARMVNEIILN